jgi:hypothetical protein
MTKAMTKEWMMKRRFWYRSLLVGMIALLSVSAAASSKPDTAQGWMQRVIAAYGGRAALEQVHTLVYEGRIVALMRGGRGTETISLQRPRRMRVTIRYRRFGEQRILNGDAVWRGFGAGFEKSSGPARLAVIYQYKQFDLPMGLLDGHYRVTLGQEERDGRTYPVLLLNDAEGPPMRVTIDPDTALIRRVSGIFRMQGQSTRLAVAYRDYRKVGKIPLPYRLVNYAGGMKIAEARFNRVEVNAKLPAGLFHP